ncbi:hypothetical protein [Mesorhizobium sp. SARCC-RB16n]|uniref:hypothetical protein n=1 Tax=Mesorhizobium sp. SARCC-RB16n TaxID=2116687 RepID=UPI00358E9080
MNIVSTTSDVARTAAPLGTRAPAASDRVQVIFQAALLPVTTAALRTAMMDSFGGTDAQGFWVWKEAYEALEAVQVLFLRRFGSAILSRSITPQATLAMMKRIAKLIPTHTRRSDESQAMQQLSTPLPLAFVAALAAAISSSVRALEPSAGTGLLAVHAEIGRATLVLNELAATRADLLGRMFPRVPVSPHDAAHIDDHLDAAIEPSVVLMNPPFTVGAYVDGHVADAAWRHLSSAFARLRPGGRLVAFTGTGLSPENPKWRAAFERQQQQGTVIFTAAIDGRVYARHGTTAETRLTVIDKIPAADPSRFVASPGRATDVETLLSCIMDLPPRTPGGFPDSIGALSNGILRNAAMQMAGRPTAVAAPASATSFAPKAVRPARPVARATPSHGALASSACSIAPISVDCRVYRMQTDAGERIIGGDIAPTLVATMYRNLGLDDVPTLAPEEAWTGLVDGRIGLQLADGLILRRGRVMSDYRVELIGFTDAIVPRLRALGLILEITSWKLRLFIPTATQGPDILASLLDRHTLVGVTDPTAAA